LLLIAEIRGHFLRQLVLHCQLVAQQVEKHTPRYEHFINDATFVQSLAKRHLVQGSHKDLNIEVVDLFRSISEVAASAIKFGLPDPSKDPLYGEILQHAKCIFDSGKKAVTVITACTIALTYTGEKQQLEAEAMVKRRSDQLPVALASHLADLGAKKGTKRSAADAKLESK